MNIVSTEFNFLKPFYCSPAWQQPWSFIKYN